MIGHHRLSTARSVDALKPKDARYIVRDSKVSGLELCVHPSNVKVWSLRYRVHGHQRRLKLGDYPRLTLSAVRERATRELRKVDLKIDPQAERQEAKRAAEDARANSIEALCDAYLTRHAKPKKRTWRQDAGTLRREVLRPWKGRAVSSITRRDCRELVKAIAHRGAPIYANRVTALLSRLFRFAVDDEVIAVNPAAHLPKPGVEAQSRPHADQESKAYDADEIRAIWTATEELDPAWRALYRLGLVTGQRPSEIGNMAWSEVEESWWTLPSRRTKNGREHRVYLSTLARDLLADVPRADDEPFVFAGRRGKRQMSAVNARVFAGVRLRVRPRHAMRDTVATGLAANGVAVENIATILNHAYGPRVTQGYNAYAYDREKQAALEVWDRELRRILIHGTKSAAKVLPMGRGR